MILIIDFGSQYNQLIARRVRENSVYCQIEAPTISLEKIKELPVEGIILSGGPASVYAKNSPMVDKGIFALGVPVLGICYGMQFMVHSLGGKVSRSQKREFGFADLELLGECPVFANVPAKTSCWMSHGDSIAKLPAGFMTTAKSANTAVAAMADTKRKLYGLQFHPEVVHTPEGKQIIKNFLFAICACQRDWTMKSFIKSEVEEIRHTVGDKGVILGLSGGVDSSVAAVLLQRAIGNKLTCVFVDNGLLRAGELAQVQDLFQNHYRIKLKVARAGKEFLTNLKGVEDPEKKRKIIGKTFIKVFEREALKIKNGEFLAQGTLYPDIIESQSAFGGPSVVIKSHHNVGGLPKRMKLKLVEPLKHLFKDEVRLLGKELGLPETLVWRQPFPGPGLAVRIIGTVSPKRLAILRQADAIVDEEIRLAGFYRKLWQSFAV
ncbi:MAG: glutamine-hydrolyzing GMP synthase, partial [Deltaproteobacteria bacterium]|nr:glutamine-hydrolyzing GMP synthase [Deltaproteobacteria bacterium]